MGAHKQEGCVQRTMRSAMMVALSFFVANAIAFQVPAGFTAMQKPTSQPVRRYSSGGKGGDTSSTTPFTPVANSIKIKQTVKITGLTAAQFTGATQTMYNLGYGHTIGIVGKGNASKAGCKVESTASRRSVSVAYTATVSPTEQDTAKAAAKALENDPSKLVAGLNSAKAGDATGAFAAITVPTADKFTVEPYTTEAIVSGAATNAFTSVFSFAAVLIAVTFAKW